MAAAPNTSPAVGGQNWLAPLSQGQIVKQAQQNVKAAYAPGYKTLSDEESRAKGLSDKRTSDNKYYTTWLQSQMGALQAHNDAAMANIQQWERGIVGQQTTTYAGQAGALVNQANSAAGNVSNNAQSKAFGAGSQLASNQAGTSMQTAGNELAGAQQQGLEKTALSATQANDFAFSNAAQQKQLSDLGAVLDKISTARDTLSQKQGASLQQEIARLQGVQINVAQSNRAYDAAAAKLGLQAANTQSLINQRAASTAQAGLNYNLNLTKAQNAQMNSDRTYQLDKQKYDSQTAKDLYLRQNGLGPYKPAKGSGGNGFKPLSHASQNAIFNKITAVQGQFNLLLKAGNSPQQAWHMLHNGYYLSTPSAYPGGTDPTTGKKYGAAAPGKKYYPPVGDDGLLNAAYNTRDAYGQYLGGGGLSPGDVNYLHGLGVIIGNRLAIVPNYNSSQNYQGPH